MNLLLKLTFILFLFFVTLNHSYSQVGINTDNANPDPSAILDIKSDSKGVLFPRMTALQRSAINNPARGLMVYQTDTLQGLFVFDGVEWQSITSKFITGQFKAPAPGNWIFKGPSNEQSNVSGLVLVGGLWQSFTAESTGLLFQIDILFLAGRSLAGPTIRIYEGEGLGGTLLYSAQYGPSSGDWQSFVIGSPLALQAGSMYTIYILDATGVWSQQRGGDVYPGGRASHFSGEDDFAFRTFIRGGEINAFSIDSTAVGLANNAIWVNELGNVGINTSTPSSRLDVNGMLRADSLSGDGSMLTNLPGDDLGNHIASTNIQLGSNWLSGDGGNEGVFIDASGNIGIGLTTPDGLFEVLGSGLDAQLKFGGTGGDAHHISSKRDFVFNASNGFLFRSADYNNLASYTDLMVIDNSGKVGIGTTNPTKGILEISGFERNIALSYGWLNASGNTGTSVGNTNISLYASHRIAAEEFNAFSDARIKNITGLSNREEDLNTLMAIQITNYQHIDTIQKGTASKKKVIAQQVAEVFPQAVTKNTTEVIPDIYQRAKRRDNWIYLTTNLQKGDRVKIISNTSNNIHEVLEVEKNRFQVSDLYSQVSDLFVYGREVDDFHTVDYEAISMLNVSATQELADRIGGQQKRIEALGLENAQLKAKILEFENQIAKIESLLQNQTIPIVKR